MKIHEVIALIPEDSENEALLSIQSITQWAGKYAYIFCHMFNEFKIRIQVELDNILFKTEDRPGIKCSTDNFLSCLKKEIYAIDEAISNNSYKQKKVSPYILPSNVPPAPDYMDLPTWDSEDKRWYDAEY